MTVADTADETDRRGDRLQDNPAGSGASRTIDFNLTQLSELPAGVRVRRHACGRHRKSRCRRRRRARRRRASKAILPAPHRLRRSTAGPWGLLLRVHSSGLDREDRSCHILHCEKGCDVRSHGAVHARLGTVRLEIQDETVAPASRNKKKRRIGNACSRLSDPGGRWHGRISLSEPVVVDAYCLELGLHR